MRTLIAFTLAGLLASCASDSSNAKSADSAETLPATVTTPDVDLSALGVPNATLPEEGLLCAGQLSPEQMSALHEAGYRKFISLRLADEKGAGWEEAYAKENGIEFVRLPVAGAAAIGEDTAGALRAEMERSDVPTALYCGSSNRVGALLGLAKVKIDGASPEEGLEFAKSAGLTRLEPLFREKVGM